MSRPAYQRRRIGRRAALAMAVGLVAAAAAGCGFSSNDPVIDSWPVGPLQPCPEPNVPNHEPRPALWDCQAALSDWLMTAQQAFDERNPGHSPIVHLTLHDEGAMRDPAGNQILVTRSGGGLVRVAVFELADGSMHALGVAHLGVETMHLNTIYEGP